MAGFTAPAAIDGIEFVDFLCLTARMKPLGAPFTNTTPFRFVELLYFIPQSTAAQEGVGLFILFALWLVALLVRSLSRSAMAGHGP